MHFNLALGPLREFMQATAVPPKVALACKADNIDYRGSFDVSSECLQQI